MTSVGQDRQDYLKMLEEVNRKLDSMTSPLVKPVPQEPKRKELTKVGAYGRLRFDDLEESEKTDTKNFLKPASKTNSRFLDHMTKKNSGEAQFESRSDQPVKDKKAGPLQPVSEVDSDKENGEAYAYRGSALGAIPKTKRASRSGADSSFPAEASFISRESDFLIESRPPQEKPSLIDGRRFRPKSNFKCEMSNGGKKQPGSFFDIDKDEDDDVNYDIGSDNDIAIGRDSGKKMKGNRVSLKTGINSGESSSLIRKSKQEIRNVQASDVSYHVDVDVERRLTRNVEKLRRVEGTDGDVRKWVDSFDRMMDRRRTEDRKVRSANPGQLSEWVKQQAAIFCRRKMENEEALKKSCQLLKTVQIDQKQKKTAFDKSVSKEFRTGKEIGFSEKKSGPGIEMRSLPPSEPTKPGEPSAQRSWWRRVVDNVTGMIGKEDIRFLQVSSTCVYSLFENVLKIF